MNKQLETFFAHRHVLKWDQNDALHQLGNALCKSLIDTNPRIVLIGTGFYDEQYYDWPEILEEIWSATISYVEICDEYIEKWKNKKYPIIKGDATSLKDVNIGDPHAIFWFQGPEHIRHEQMLATFDQLFAMASRSFVATCPWGSYYDKQGSINNNVWETHVQKSMCRDTFGPEFCNYQISLGGSATKGSGQILIERYHE